MSEPTDWNPLLTHRHHAGEQPDDETIRQRIKGWKTLLALDDDVAEPLLDHELAKLLDEIHRDY